MARVFDIAHMGAVAALPTLRLVAMSGRFSASPVAYPGRFSRRFGARGYVTVEAFHFRVAVILDQMTFVVRALSDVQQGVTSRDTGS